MTPDADEETLDAAAREVARRLNVILVALWLRGDPDGVSPQVFGVHGLGRRRRRKRAIRA